MGAAASQHHSHATFNLPSKNLRKMDNIHHYNPFTGGYHDSVPRLNTQVITTHYIRWGVLWYQPLTGHYEGGDWYAWLWDERSFIDYNEYTPESSTEESATSKDDLSLDDLREDHDREETENTSISNSPPGSAIPPPLAPSQEEAYRRKCIQLRRRMNEVEESNDVSQHLRPILFTVNINTIVGCSSQTRSNGQRH